MVDGLLGGGGHDGRDRVPPPRAVDGKVIDVSASRCSIVPCAMVGKTTSADEEVFDVQEDLPPPPPKPSKSKSKPASAAP